MVRHIPFSTASLSNVDCTTNFARDMSRGERVLSIATTPLTKDKDWKEFCRGHILMFDRGLPFSELYDCIEVERGRRGLCSRAFPKDVQTSVNITSICNQIIGTGSVATNTTNMTTTYNGDIRDRGEGGGGVSLMLSSGGGEDRR